MKSIVHKPQVHIHLSCIWFTKLCKKALSGAFGETYHSNFKQIQTMVCIALGAYALYIIDFIYEKVESEQNLSCVQHFQNRFLDSANHDSKVTSKI